MLPRYWDVDRRRPVWEALSGLFLYTQPDQGTYDYILRRCAESGYTDVELDRILWTEVAPVLHWNLYDIMGEEHGFLIEFIEPSIVKRRGLLYWLNRLLLMRLAVSEIRGRWSDVKQRLAEARKQYCSKW